jgi:hypothetical protein
MVYECPLDRWTDVRGSQLRLRDFARAAGDLARIYWRDVRGRAFVQQSTSPPIGRPKSTVDERKAA